jgi:hypothetical protein
MRLYFTPSRRLFPLALGAFITLGAFGSAALVKLHLGQRTTSDSKAIRLAVCAGAISARIAAGRSVAVAGVSSQPNVYYFGGTGGRRV